MAESPQRRAALARAATTTGTRPRRWRSTLASTKGCSRESSDRQTPPVTPMSARSPQRRAALARAATLARGPVRRHIVQASTKGCSRESSDLPGLGWVAPIRRGLNEGLLSREQRHVDVDEAGSDVQVDASTKGCSRESSDPAPQRLRRQRGRSPQRRAALARAATCRAARQAPAPRAGLNEGLLSREQRPSAHIARRPASVSSPQRRAALARAATALPFWQG